MHVHNRHDRYVRRLVNKDYIQPELRSDIKSSKED